MAALSAGRTKLKALLSDYRKQLPVPRAQSVVEAKWRTGADNARYMASHGEDRWRAWDLGLDGTPIRWVRAWAKLRLQGALACSSTGVPPRCRLCGGCLETAHHLLVECAAGRRVCDEWAMRQGIPLLPASAARPMHSRRRPPRARQKPSRLSSEPREGLSAGRPCDGSRDSDGWAGAPARIGHHAAGG